MRVRAQKAPSRSALSLAVWLLLLCGGSACTGPGLEPPGDRNETSAPGDDAGPLPEGGSGAQAGTGGSGGAGGMQSADPGTNGGTDGDSDAGEASMDASVDEDGGADPAEVEP